MMASKEAAKPETGTFTTSSQVKPANAKWAPTFQFRAGAPRTQETRLPFMSAMVLMLASLAVATDKPKVPMLVISRRSGCGPQFLSAKINTPS